MYTKDIVELAVWSIAAGCCYVAVMWAALGM